MGLIVTPFAPDKMNQTQPNIKQNIDDIDRAWNVNHVTYVGPSDPPNAQNGFHTQIDLPVPFNGFPSTSPEYLPITPEGSFSLFTLFASLGIPQSTTVTMASRRGTSDNTAEPVLWEEFLKKSPGYTRLPSGILMQWGNGGIPRGSQNLAPNEQRVVFPKEFNTVLCVAVKGWTSSKSDFSIPMIKDGTLTNKEFIGTGAQYRPSLGTIGHPEKSVDFNITVPFNWIAIGV